MFIGEIDKCTHILTAYISSSYDYCNFLDTQLDDFILDTQLDDFISEYGETVVETCLHQVLLLVSRYN
ncbi:hypothetical protein [Clostridioides difficile]|uniref:hypothetical protein n=1 Tax=Clostridioides difficile TaxID=1496 RepID=UPI0010344E90|nr:hypothetical protein [Clostridioides difficile]